MYGYTGKVLRVDLDSGVTLDEPLSVEYARSFVGGSGLAARYLWDIMRTGIDPLGSENPLMIMTGPMVGTIMPSAGRCSVCAVSPLTGIWGEANTGGFFGPELRFAGYDGIIISGRSAKPVWLSILNGRAEVRDAVSLWGKDTYETQEGLRRFLNDRRVRIACIGQADENQVSMAAVMNDRGRAAGRTGMGAVMGSKNLKAVAVRGAAPVPVSDSRQLEHAVRDIIAISKDDPASTALGLAGTAGYVDMALMYGDLPIRYFQQGEWEEAERLSGVLMAEEHQNRKSACYRCPIRCGRETRAPGYGIEKVDGPEYETVCALGSLLMISNLEDVIYSGHLCNVYGLDTISTGCVIGLACEMFDRGILAPSDTGGLDIRYGDPEVVHRLIKLTARREGFGSILAEGSSALAERFGVPELAVTVNRLDVPMHDPRAFAGMAVSYALSPRGACHMEGDMYGVDVGQGPAVELGVLPGNRFDSSEEKGRTSALNQAWRNFYNSLVLCQFQNPGVDLVLSSLNSITGWGLRPEDLMTLGKRILTLKRMLNFRLGLTRADDRLPDLLLSPLQRGGTEGAVPDTRRLLAGAYSELGWAPDTGEPTEKTLQELDLNLPE
ncbi:MAG: aldehyde ferredoxin oxidoreductase family protein [Dehalococcoidia bacterium]|nr:aldehyde ferredoxin oxidoreductase family protein [Dehalococcoidia bacterium]